MKWQFGIREMCFFAQSETRRLISLSCVYGKYKAAARQLFYNDWKKLEVASLLFCIFRNVV